MNDLFFDIGLILIATTLLGLLSHALRQSLVLAYLVAGILMGPAGQKLILLVNETLKLNIPAFHVINNVDLINTLSVFGVILLLFVVGLEMNIKELKGLKKAILMVCLGQITLTFVLGYFLALPFVKSHTVALLTGTALTFSSTIIGIKLLSDKKDLNSLYGKVVIGILLAQDLVAIFALVLLSSLGGESGLAPEAIGLIVAKFLGLFGFTIVWSSVILPRLFSAIAGSSELVFLAAIANCFLLAGMAHLLNISVEIGAFLGGLSLASLPHYLQLISKIRPLRDFFLILFFVSLGLHFDPVSIAANRYLLVALTLFAVFIKPLIILLVVTLAGFKKRTAFMSGLSLAQLSEFSLIVLGAAMVHGLIDNALLSTLTLVTILSILISTHLAYHGQSLFLKVGKYLHFLEVRDPIEKMHSFRKKLNRHIILCGYEGMGEPILRSIKKAKRRHVVVDINPEHIRELIKKKSPYIFGDITDPEVLELMNIPKADILISTISRFEDNLFVLEYARRHNPKMLIFLEAQSPTQALDLYSRGADYVILTEHIGGDHTSLLLEDLYGKQNDRFFRHKTRHIDFLKRKFGAV